MEVRRLMRLAPRMVRRLPKIARNAVRDLRYGGFLGGTVKTRYGHLGAHDVGNVEYEDLPPLFEPANVQPDDVIVDVGAGKGRSINWLLERYPENRIVGIELDPEIATKTAKRLRRFPNVTIAADGMHPQRRIVYHNCKDVELFRADPRFDVREITLPSGSFRAALVTLR